MCHLSPPNPFFWIKSIQEILTREITSLMHIEPSAGEI